MPSAKLMRITLKKTRAKRRISQPGRADHQAVNRAGDSQRGAPAEDVTGDPRSRTCGDSLMSTPQLATEACENCGRLIGRLETPHVLGENIVCAECHAILAPHLHPVPYATPESAAQSSIGSTGENKDAVFCLALLLAGAGLLV